MPPKRVSARMESSNIVDIGSPEFKTDDFRMYGLKVIECSRRYTHDWTTCPYAHPNEKARRRDPKLYNYTGMACPFIKQASSPPCQPITHHLVRLQNNHCTYGDRCPYAHNVFEYWLHPTRYRTQLCNIAASCNRTICFFAHTIEELRVPIPAGIPPNLMSSFPQESQNSQQNLNPFSRRPTELPLLSGIDDTFPMALQPQAKYILDQLIASRQITSDLRLSSSPMSDLSDIQTLISLLQHQQILAGVSDQSPEIQLTFLNGLFHSLAQVVCTTPMQDPEKDRLTKLIQWMYVQLVQNKQSLFSTGESMALFAPQPPDLLQNPLVQQLGEAMQSRISLSSIPETMEATSQFHARQGTSFSVHPLNSTPQSLEAFPFRSVPQMRATSLDGVASPLGYFGSQLRHSDESSTTRMSGTRASGASSFQRSSADSESYPGIRGVHSQDSSRMSWEDPNTPPVFIYHEWLSHNSTQPPSSGI